MGADRGFLGRQIEGSMFGEPEGASMIRLGDEFRTTRSGIVIAKCCFAVVA